MAVGSSLVDPYGWEDEDEDPTFAQDSSTSGQCAQQWGLRTLAQEAALKVIADSRLRKFLAHNKSFTCTNIKTGDTARFYKAQNKKSAPHWRAPALILVIDETGATVKTQSQTF